MCACLIGLVLLYFYQHPGKSIPEVATAPQALVLGCDTWSKHPSCPTVMLARNKCLLSNATEIIGIFYYTELLCQ